MAPTVTLAACRQTDASTEVPKKVPRAFSNSEVKARNAIVISLSNSIETFLLFLADDTFAASDSAAAPDSMSAWTSGSSAGALNVVSATCDTNADQIVEHFEVRFVNQYLQADPMAALASSSQRHLLLPFLSLNFCAHSTSTVARHTD